MRRELRRLASVSGITAVLVLALPLLTIALIRWNYGPLAADSGRLAAFRPLIMVLAVGLLSAVAVLVVGRRAERQAAHLADAIDQLVDRAEAIGTGTRLAGLPQSGIEELDRLAAAITRSDHTMARSLAAERQFAADASHQLRTPLTALALRLEEIAALDDLTEMRAEAEAALGQVERLNKVVDDLRTRSRSGDGEVREASLDAILAALQRDWQLPFTRARRSIRVGGERGVKVRGSASMISQVLATLLENSLKHGAGTVEVDVRRSGPSVVIEMSDHGPGVDPAIAARIFERSVTSGRGTGLGLGVARGLVEACGGRLELVSAKPATFAVFLSEAGIH